MDAPAPNAPILTTPKRGKLTILQIWNMSFGFLGIQFGFALQNANVSRIFQTLGAEIDNIAILWIAAPVTGLLVQPIIGYLSDRTWHPYWGRRRPFFYRRYPCISGIVPYAQFKRFMDGSFVVMGFGCFYQYFNGTVQGFCRGYAPVLSTYNRV